MTMITTKQIDQIVEDLIVLRRDIQTIEEAAARDPGVPGQQPDEDQDVEEGVRRMTDQEYIRERLRHMERSGVQILDEEQFARPFFEEDDKTGEEWFKLNTAEPRWFTHDQLKRSGPIFFEDNREAP